MTRRERVLKALNFETTDRLPKDLGAHRSTGISCFAYEKLVDALGLKPRDTKVWDTSQMLALPDLDVLDALDCDVIAVDGHLTNAFPQPHLWKPYDFNGRLKTGAVVNPDVFRIDNDGTIYQNETKKMPPSSYVFDSEHGGQPFDLTGELVKEDLEELELKLKSRTYTDDYLRKVENICKDVRNSTDRAVFYTGYNGAMGFRGGYVKFGMLCLLEPEYVTDIHTLLTEYNVKNLKLLLQAISPYVDILMTIGEDMGTQNATMVSPDTFDELFAPFFKKINHTVHENAPKIKTFMHSCGAIYEILDSIIDTEIDILNPVQWSAGGHHFSEWKDKVRNRISFWGGGVNSQVTLPLGSITDIENETAKVCEYFKQDGGFVFNNIHNILAEIDPKKVIAMYQTASKY